MGGLKKTKDLNKKLFDCLSEDMPKLLHIENQDINDQENQTDFHNQNGVAKTLSGPLQIRKGNMKEQADLIINRLLSSNMQAGQHYSPNIDISSLVSNNILSSMGAKNNNQLKNETQSYAP